jgi:hypothetical protein
MAMTRTEGDTQAEKFQTARGFPVLFRGPQTSWQDFAMKDEHRTEVDAGGQ